MDELECKWEDIDITDAGELNWRRVAGVINYGRVVKYVDGENHVRIYTSKPVFGQRCFIVSFDSIDGAAEHDACVRKLDKVLNPEARTRAAGSRPSSGLRFSCSSSQIRL